MPKPIAAHEKLARLAGDWEGDEILHPAPWNPERRSARGRFHNRLELDGFFLINDYTQERDGKVIFRGHGVYGYDPKRERYTMHWFDVMGMPPRENLGTFDGDRLVFEAENAEFKARYVYVLHGSERYEFRIESSQDGREWKPVMEGDYERTAC